ncbi:hypothetical protein NDU88_000200 [Pleurodeles waltl]|uniref:Uncharacterized protein n=1 Tax=Pleurodeles waltl TaxID=8319 RepID=A0AAV7LHW6_PLEWA|nr:hypothetical protein NDU88_000200 [Pleurodeles waltl]
MTRGGAAGRVGRIRCGVRHNEEQLQDEMRSRGGRTPQRPRASPASVSGPRRSAPGTDLPPPSSGHTAPRSPG